MNRLTYAPIPEYDRDAALHEIESGVTGRIVRGLFALASFDTDWRWVQNLCTTFSNSPNDDVRGTALLCFGYIARVHGALDIDVAVPIIIDGLNSTRNHVCGCAEDALNDVLIFCRPRNYDRAAALELLGAERIDKTLLGLFAIAKGDKDSEFAQSKCIEYSDHPDKVIRGQALKGFATIVYEHRQIDIEKVMRVLSAHAKQDGYAGACARSTIECIDTYQAVDD